MNHFLVKVLGIINGAIAIAIVIFFAILGGHGMSFSQLSQTGEQLPPFSLAGSIFGAIIGLVIAALVCGLLAVAISVEKSLKHIATKLPWPEGRSEVG